MKNLAFKITVAIVLFCAYPFQILAQVDEFPESPDGGEDPLPQASIDNYIFILWVVALVLGIYLKMRPIFNSDSHSAQN